MKKEDLFQAISGVDEKYIQRAQMSSLKRKKSWTKWVTIAACFCLILGVSFQIQDQIEHSLLSDNVNEQYARNENGYFIPAIQLPKETNAELDMIGTLVYKGKIYTQAESYYDESVIDVEDLVGDYIGYAVGNLEEWSTQEDYATEFASTYTGDVYSVKGYDTNFRLCINVSDDGGNKSLIMLENLNGIYLNTGADLFETRLHLPNNWSNVHYLTHSNWDNGNHNYMKMSGISNEEINAFIDELSSNDFVYMDYEETPNIYDVKKQGHLFFEMKDGTTIELRLFEGGYVGYQSLGWYFVKMPSSTFESIFNACQ